MKIRFILMIKLENLLNFKNRVWYSDDDPEEIASLAIISKWDNKIHLKFQEGLHMEGIIATSIQIRTDGSRYDYLYIPFKEMYNEVWTTDFSYHQMNLDENVRIRSKKS
jgi:hypothetical protein